MDVGLVVTILVAFPMLMILFFCQLVYMI